MGQGGMRVTSSLFIIGWQQVCNLQLGHERGHVLHWEEFGGRLAGFGFRSAAL
jgi:hypothetical protein